MAERTFTVPVVKDDDGIRRPNLRGMPVSAQIEEDRGDEMVVRVTAHIDAIRELEERIDEDWEAAPTGPAQVEPGSEITAFDVTSSGGGSAVPEPPRTGATDQPPEAGRNIVTEPAMADDGSVAGADQAPGEATPGGGTPDEPGSDPTRPGGGRRR